MKIKQIKNFIDKILYPGISWRILFTLCAAGLLIYIFTTGSEETPVAYISYAFSTYALAVVVCSVPGLVRKGKTIAYGNAYSSRYLKDVSFRMRVSLYLSLCINLVYAVIKFLSGIYYHSLWFGAVSVYYILLSIVRFLLLCHVNQNKLGENRRLEYRKYRLCGVMLVVLNVALTGMVLQMIWKNRGYQYPGFLIYGLAAYAFYTIITAVINLVKYRRYNSPVLSAAKAINFTTALVSILSLQTAMLTQFGGGDEEFQRGMNMISGAAVCLIVLAMAVYMVLRANRELNEK